MPRSAAPARPFARATRFPVASIPVALDHVAFVVVEIEVELRAVAAAGSSFALAVSILVPRIRAVFVCAFVGTGAIAAASPGPPLPPPTFFFLGRPVPEFGPLPMRRGDRAATLPWLLDANSVAAAILFRIVVVVEEVSAPVKA